MWKTKFVVAVSVLALCGVGSGAAAQSYMPSFSNGNLSGYVAQNTHSTNQLERGARQGGSRSSSDSGAGASATRGALTTSTGYRTSPAVTSRVKQQFSDFVRSTGGNGPGIAAAMEREDFFARWGRHVAQYGLRRGDVADAMTAYWFLNWQIANDVRSVSRSQVQAAKNQVQSRMRTNANFADLTEAQKQEMAEVLILNFIAQSVAYEDAMRDNDASMQRRLQNAAIARFRNEMGLNLQDMQLTEAGFSGA